MRSGNDQEMSLSLRIPPHHPCALHRARKKGSALALTFTGRWRIVAMDLWDKDAIDLVVPGFISFNGEEGEMRFIAHPCMARHTLRYPRRRPRRRVLVGGR